MPKSDETLKAVVETGQLVTLALNGVNVLLPLVTGIIKEVREARENEQGEVEYTLVLAAGKENLTVAAESFDRVLELVNAERERLGLPKLG